jgi:hypothetical protein
MKLRFVRNDWYKLKMYYNQERSLQVLPNKIIQPEFENQNPEDQEALGGCLENILNYYYGKVSSKW